MKMTREQLTVLRNWLILSNENKVPTWRELLKARRNTLYEAHHGGVANHSHYGTIVIYDDGSYSTYGGHPG